MSIIEGYLGIITSKRRELRNLRTTQVDNRKNNRPKLDLYSGLQSPERLGKDKRSMVLPIYSALRIEQESCGIQQHNLGSWET